MRYVGQYFYNESNNVSLRICHISFEHQKLAVADMQAALGNINARRPDIYTFDDFDKYIKTEDLSEGELSLPPEILMSDQVLKDKGRQKWLDRRDIKYKAIQPLTSEVMLEQYLYLSGIGDETAELATTGRWKTPGAYYNALNRYITFGCTLNGLLPFRLKNTGSNYLHIQEPGEGNIKRGRGGKNNQRSRSKSRGVTKKDKNQIEKLAKYIKKSKFRKHIVKRAHDLYISTFESTEVQWDTPTGVEKRTVPFPEKDRLSKHQFRYHFNNTLSRVDLLKIRYGNVAYEKDHAPKEGVAQDGVIGPSFRYEIDATVLDIYVRYPYDTTGRYTMGRPILYLVIDVFTTMVVGMYIGFHGPDWTGASEAMVNAMMDKVQYAAQFGKKIKSEEWPCHHIPVQLTTDNGSEYSLNNVTSVIRAELGILTTNFVAVFRGDAKGIVEREFGVINDARIHFEAGAITPFVRRDEAHPSNQALWDLDTLHSMIIEEIIYHNNNADRLHLHDKKAARLNIGITPRALWDYAIYEEMNGGRPTKPEDEARVRWAFLPEEFATVTGSGIKFKGLEYHSDYARKVSWYTKAKHHGAFKIPIRWTKTSTNFIWFRADDGEIIPLQLKLSKSKRYANERWEAVLHRIEQYKDKQHEQENQSIEDMVNKERRIDELRAQNQSEVDQAPENSRKSPQTDIAFRKKMQAQLEKANIARKTQEKLGGNSKPSSPSLKHAPTGLDEKIQDANNQETTHES